jgi:hypothetical protein
MLFQGKEVASVGSQADHPVSHPFQPLKIRLTSSSNMKEPLWDFPSQVTLQQLSPSSSEAVSIASSYIEPEVLEELEELEEEQIEDSRVFHMFQELPVELQMQIWRNAAFPQVVELQESQRIKYVYFRVYFPPTHQVWQFEALKVVVLTPISSSFTAQNRYHYDYEVVRKTPLPAMLHLCRSSRAVVLSRVGAWTQIDPSEEIASRVFIHENDILYVSHPPYPLRYTFCNIPPATDHMFIAVKNVIDCSFVRRLAINQVYLEAFTYYFRTFVFYSPDDSYLLPLLNLEEVIVVYDKQNPTAMRIHADMLQGILSVMNIKRYKLNKVWRKTPITTMKENEFRRLYN